MNRRMRFRDHPIHPAITDFPIALLPLALLWDAIALWQNGDFWWKAAFWTLVAGLAAALPTATTGFLDYVTLDRSSRAFRTATSHMLVMLTAVSLFAGSAVAQGGPSEVSGGQAALVVSLAILGVLLLGVGGWLGGELVYREGVGVEPNRHPSEGDPSQSPAFQTSDEDRESRVSTPLTSPE